MLTDNQKNLIRIYYPVMKPKDLLEQLGCSRSELDWFVKSEGLRRLDDDLMTYREIAECLGISEVTAYNTCDKALKKILAIVMNDPILRQHFIEYIN